MHLEPVTNRENALRGIRVALKTHCAQGHPWISENIFVRPNGRKFCRVCSAIGNRKRYAQRKANA
jgi:hypothetical protein